MRTHPCETRPGRISGWFVPWIPMKPPPGQSVSTTERAFSPKARGPYVGRGKRDTLNTADGIYRDQHGRDLHLRVTQTKEGYEAAYNIGLRIG